MTDTSRNTPVSPSISTLVKRRVLPLAATTAAAVSLAGCAMGGAASGGASADTDVHQLLTSHPVVLPSQTQAARETEARAKKFAEDIQLALDQTDRNRLAAAEKKAAALKEAAGQQNVILASSAADAHDSHAAPTPAPAVTHDAPKPAAPAPVAPTVQEAPKESPKPAVAAAPAPAPAPKPVVAKLPDAPAPMPSAVITPIAVPPSQTPSAMGAMVASAAPAAIEKITAAPTPAVAAPAPAPEPSLEDALAIVKKNLAGKPSLNTALALALLDTHGKTDELLAGLPDADQKVVSDLLTALQGMSARTGAANIAERAAPLLDAAKKWQTDGDLLLPKLVLATRVDSFGVYSAVEPKFEQGKQATVIIYCEVANFSSKKSDDGWYQTKLAQQETLITDDGLLVWRPNAEEIEDKSMNQRHDFYLVKKLTIPGNLAAGKYTLRMSVTDRNSNKLNMVTLPIEITAK